jgi:ATP-dependent Lon protease
MVRSGDDLAVRDRSQVVVEDFYRVGVAAKVVQAAPPPPTGPMQLVVQVAERFGVAEFVAESPVFRARVEYWYETEFRTNEELKAEIGQRIEERISKQQREFFLKEQLKEIKKELGLTKEDSQTEADKIEARIGKLTLTDEAREKINEELEKLKLLEPSSPEFNVTRAYLDWLTVLPWGVYTEDNYDIARAARRSTSLVSV